MEQVFGDFKCAPGIGRWWLMAVKGISKECFSNVSQISTPTDKPTSQSTRLTSLPKKPKGHTSDWQNHHLNLTDVKPTTPTCSSSPIYLATNQHVSLCAQTNKQNIQPDENMSFSKKLIYTTSRINFNTNNLPERPTVWLKLHIKMSRSVIQLRPHVDISRKTPNKI